MTSNHGYILDAAPPPPPKTPGSSGRVQSADELFLAAVEARAKGVDLALYRRLPGLFESVGLTEIGGEVTNVLVRRDGRGAVLGTLEAMRPHLAEIPFVTDGRIDRLIKLCSDPTLMTMGGSTLALWGRRPA